MGEPAFAVCRKPPSLTSTFDLNQKVKAQIAGNVKVR